MRAGIIAVVFAWFAGSAHAETWRDPSPHRVLFVGVEARVALEVLDWGGSGPALVFLAGLGNTAHVFDEFALHFTDRFHVVGITRRGYGASSQPETGYDVATLSRDILTVCDRLEFPRVVLVGHSIAGEELTKFASTYPTRVRALVYLDAAYDRTGPPPQAPRPMQPDPTPAEMASPAALNDYITRVFGVRKPEADLRAEIVTDASGRYIRDVTSDDVPQAIRRGVERPDYSHISAPALAIYQPNIARFIFPGYAAFSDSDKALADGVAREDEPMRIRSMEQFRRELVQGRVVRLTTGSHYLFITNSAEVIALIRDFLHDVED